MKFREPHVIDKYYCGTTLRSYGLESPCPGCNTLNFFLRGAMAK